MAASITKRASPFGGRRFSVINQLIFRYVRPITTGKQWGTHSCRCIHRETSDSDRNSQNHAPTTDTSSKLPDAGASGHRHAEHGQERSRLSSVERNGETEAPSEIPYAVVSARRRLRKYHNISEGSSTYSHDWDKEFAINNIKKLHQMLTDPRTTGEAALQEKGSITPESDFFGVLEDMNNKPKYNAETFGDAAAFRSSLRKKRKRQHPGKIFEHILNAEKDYFKLETVVDFPFGTVRRDQDNIVRSHGRVQAVNYVKTTPQGSSVRNEQDKIESHIFDEQYFGTTDRKLSEKSPFSKESKPEDHHDYISDKYIPSETITKESVDKTSKAHESETVDSYIDAQYFAYDFSTNIDVNKPIANDLLTSGGTKQLPGVMQHMELSCPDPEAVMEPNDRNDRSIQPTNIAKSLIRSPLTETRNVSNSTNVHSVNNSTMPPLDANLFDEQYFPEPAKEELERTKSVHMNKSIMSTPSLLTETRNVSKSTNVHSVNNSTMPPLDANLFDEQYFPEAAKEELERTKSVLMNKSTMSPSDSNLVDVQYSPAAAKEGISSEFVSKDTMPSANVHFEGHPDVDKSYGQSGKKIDVLKPASSPPEMERTEFHEYVGGHTKQQLRARNKLKPNLDNPETAYDFAMKLRLEKLGKVHQDSKSDTSTGKWSGAVDTMGFRKLDNQVLDIQKVPRDVVVRILQDSVLHETDDFIAIDKPYGLPSHGGPGIHHSVGQLLQYLTERIDAKHLDLVHRLDKETTGVMLLAKTPDMAWRLRGMFQERQVLKRYWMITKGVPSPLSGTIDIPIVETEVNGRYRMNVQPRKSEQTQLLLRKHQPDLPRKEAVTKYKVLDINNGAALVECEPETGVKHQIRCHMAFGLNTPILGDHKYSHYSKMAPQQLPPKMLNRLGLRQPLVRYVPMHLHAKALVLPQLSDDGRNKFVSCRLPNHFVQNMKWLKLKPPKGV